jgi:transposase-like protein
VPRRRPYPIKLTAEEEQELQSMARRYTSPYRDVIRAKIILYAAQGARNDEIAARLDTPRQIVSKWRKRFFEQRLAGLFEQPRSGRPARFPPSVVVAVKALACELPRNQSLPLSRHSIPEIKQEVLRRGLVASIGDTTIWRWLAEVAIQPWRYRTWLFPRDPAFELKAGRVLDLYEGFWEGRPLNPDDCVVSADEKTSIQARHRCHPTQGPRPHRLSRVEHEYERFGAWAYLAAWDVRRAKIHGRCEATTGIVPFDRLVDQVMSQPPYNSAPRVFWIVDNGSSHRGDACQRRLQTRWPNLVVVHTPIHGSWLNQVEIYFSVLQRKALTPDDFASLEELQERLLLFQDRYSTIARPFQWKFTRRDLHKLLARIGDQQPCQQAA